MCYENWHLIAKHSWVIFVSKIYTLWWIIHIQSINLNVPTSIMWNLNAWICRMSKTWFFSFSHSTRLVKPTSSPWTSLMAISENGHIFKAEGNKVHHEEEIVIVGGGIRGLCFVIVLHRYDVIPSSSNHHDLMLI